MRYADKIKAFNWLGTESKEYDIAIHYEIYENMDPEYWFIVDGVTYRGYSLADAIERAMNDRGGFMG